ncbi:hypothetical protein L596_021762 [Steinernema carpocapsae]|uniref:DUF19 domain-containing protein n=1 Tax=Steinernema carpocapsae TaxID=34508 RepID=A0A4U5MKI3_STECR|nr:hypothetical protein L596_021762 [Steinernema carpocapsae]
MCRLLSVFLFLALFACASGRCSPFTLKNCYTTYFEHLKLNSRHFPSYRSYDNTKHNYLNVSGLAAQKNICKWHKELGKCLEADGNTCLSSMTTAGMQTKLGISRREAVSFNTDYHAFMYQCGDGYKDMIKHFYCIRSVPHKYESEIEICSRTLDYNIGTLFECSYYNDFINCVRRIYTNECGQGVSKYVCNYEKVAMQANTHRCDSTLLLC